MRVFTLSLLAAGAAGLIAGAAVAQQSAPQGGDTTPTSANPSAPLGSPEHPIPQNSPTPATDAYKLKAGDPNVVSNPPVPDTPQNRQAYGEPMSRTGKSTRPAGN